MALDDLINIISRYNMLVLYYWEILIYADLLLR